MIYRTHKKRLNLAVFLADNLEANRLRRGKLGKDPTVETGFLPDRYVWHGISSFSHSVILFYPLP